jgi:hypothetical protein
VVNKHFSECKWKQLVSGRTIEHACASRDGSLEEVTLETSEGKLTSILVRVRLIRRDAAIGIAKDMGFSETQTTDVIQGREGTIINKIARFGLSGIPAENLLFLKNE